MRSGSLWAAVSLLLVAPGASARAAQDQDVLVRGQREIPPQVARRYVQQITSTVDGQVTRFHDPVCPVVLGFPAEYAQLIVSRIRAAATQAGAQVGEAKCADNIVILFAKDADAFVTELRTKRPRLFDGVDDADLKRAFRSGPVHAWSITEIRNEDGQRGSGDMVSVRTASILRRSTQQVIAGAIIVIDQDAAVGKSLAQLGDYLAMRALAGALPPGNGAATDTILTLFGDGDSAPPGLTRVDKSYLKGLYTVDPLAEGTAAKARISRQIGEDARERSGLAD